MSAGKYSSNKAIDAALQLDGDPAKVRDFYDDWAKSYDSDTGSADYSGPALAAELLHRHLPDTRSRLLDAGCGTGQVGRHLSARNYRHIEGFDLSEAMAKIAADSDCYLQVRGGLDIMAAGEFYPASSYDAVLSIGVFTLGHVEPTALSALLHLTRAGGLLIISTRTQYYDETGFQAQVDAMLEEGRMSLTRAVMNAPYNHDGDAHYWVFEKSG